MQLMLTIYIWFLFVIAILATLFPIFLFVIPLSDEKEDAGKMSYLLMISVLLSGLVPLIGQYIIPYDTLNILWKVILGVTIFVGLIPCIRYTTRNLHFLFGFLFTTVFAIAPLIYFGSFAPDSSNSLTSYLTGNYPISIFVVLVPILLLGIVLGYVLKPSYKIKDYMLTRDFLPLSKFEGSDAIRRTTTKYENLNQKLDNQVKKLSTAIDQFNVNLLLTKYPNYDSSKGVDRKVGTMLTKLSDDIAVIKTHLGQVKMSEINDDQQVLVRELSHFMATPLATIDASIKNLMATVKTKNEEKLQENVNRIISAVSICNGILSTYREIFVQGSISNGGNLKTMISSSFDVFNKREGKELKLQLSIKESYDNISNYYILSTVLPIISNAVTASRPKTTVEVREKNGVVRISNTYEGEIDLSNFDKDGYSSKENHRGMGLFTVRHLLARRKLGTLIYSLENNRMCFDIPISPLTENNVQ